MISAIKPKADKGLESSINVSSYGEQPYNLFSPFSYSPDFKIPVPGQEDIFANSVESIWQGLKVINDCTDFKMFSKKPKKRKGDVEGHMYDNTSLDIVSARKKIYKPAYFFYVENYVPDELKEDILKQSLDQDIYFYDVESNLDIEDPSDSLAHSVFLKKFFDSYLEDRLKDVKTNVDEEYQRSEFKHETLAEPMARGLELFENASEVDKALIKHLLNKGDFALDKFHKRYYSRLLEKIEEL